MDEEQKQDIRIVVKDSDGKVISDSANYPTTGMKVFGWIMVHRPAITILSVFGALAGYLLTTVGRGHPVDWDVMVLGLLAVGLTAGCANIVNSCIDREVDKVNKPYRPIPSGLVNSDTAIRVGVAELILAPLVALFVSVWFSIFIVIVVAITTHYNVIGKEHWLAGWIEQPLGACLIPYAGGLMAGDPFYMISLSVFIFIFEFGRDAMLYIEDVDADKIRCVTVAHKISTNSISLITLMCYLVSMFFGVISFYLNGFSNFLIFGTLAFSLGLIVMWVLSNHQGDTEESIHLWHRNISRVLIGLYQIVLVTEAFIS